MKRRMLILAAAALVLLVFACQLRNDEAEVEAAVETADAKTMEVLDLVIEAKASQDFAALESFLAEEDPDGELRALLEEEGVFAPPVQARAISGLPGFHETAHFANGDVLLSRSSGTWTSNLMSLVLTKGYGHGGILYQNLASSADPNAGCVLSADLEGLNFQTYLEWQAADSIAVMRAESALIAPSADLQYVLPEAPFPYTCYAFLLGGFQPVSRDDLYFWYCSKVPWWVYAHGLSINIENEDFYEFGDPHGKWTAFEDSLLFKVYKLYLRLTLSWRDWWKIPYLTEKKLKEVLGELITPDELRWPVADGPLSCVHTYGDDSPDYDWEDYGVTP